MDIMMPIVIIMCLTYLCISIIAIVNLAIKIDRLSEFKEIIDDSDKKSVESNGVSILSEMNRSIAHIKDEQNRQNRQLNSKITSQQSQITRHKNKATKLQKENDGLNKEIASWTHPQKNDSGEQRPMDLE